jgi:polysaccharide pyruvyl transferase WcaK-like protein
MFLEKRLTRVLLLGASFDTGNLGVSALAESSIKIILNKWPNAEVILLGSGYKPQQHHLFVSSNKVCAKTLPIRFCKNIFLPYHFLWFVLYGLLLKVLPTSRLKSTLVNHNPYFKILYEADLVADITGGDSFSDIYGFRRFFLGFLRKWLIIFLGKKLVLLPQTYGPFEGNITRAMARYILKRANTIYSRDRDSLRYVKNLLGANTKNGKVQFASDVAFVLDSRKPPDFDASPLSKISENTTVVGFNISGLLFNGGYTQDNMFGLKTDYRTLIPAVIHMLLENKDVVVLLVPHVFPPAGYEVESDPNACLKVYQQLKQKYPGRIFLVGKYDQGEMKHIIGLCDFFIGSRMHSCIAALSQGIPAVGLAYSKKFEGVFRSVSAEHFVIDMRSRDHDEILKDIAEAYDDRQATAKHLAERIPMIREEVLKLFADIV